MTKAEQTITRFAPSPTGSLHIGGARTALFDWAYAKHTGGKLMIRIEDTDRKRSTDAATRGILEDLKWLGLDWQLGPNPESENIFDDQLGDTGPYFQSQRLDIYNQYFDQLIKSGQAYHCFKTADELNDERAAARAEKRAYKYDPAQMRDLTDEQIAAYQAEGRTSVLRFRAPDKDVIFEDRILGKVTIAADQLEDIVIRKSDGYPTYHFAVVVDDALMQVSHVIRAQEHLNNTWKHWLLQEALGFEHPQYAHMPLIFNRDGSKMSKRDKAKAARQGAKDALNQKDSGWDKSTLATKAGLSEADLEAFLKKKNDEISIAEALARTLQIPLPEIDVLDFKRGGYLPEVILNYIALLGWSPGDQIERFDMDFMIERFDLTRIGKSNARFDRDKLFRFNADSIAQLDPADFTARLRQHCIDYYPEYLKKMDEHKFELFANSYRERSRTLEEPMINGRFFIMSSDDIIYDDKAMKKVIRKNDYDGETQLKDFLTALEALDDWSLEGIHTLIKTYCEEKEIGMGKVAQPIRVAVTGSTTSPPINDTLVILGKDETLKRIERLLKAIKAEKA